MKRSLPFITLIIFLALPGCNGGGHKLVVGDIQVPDSVFEYGSVICEIEASGDIGLTYAWAVDPSTAGTFDPQDTATTTFTASGVDGDTEVTVRVVVGSDHSDPVTKSAVLLVKESNEVPPWVRNQAPFADAHASTTSVEPGDVIQFFDDSTDPNGNDDIVMWEWDFSYVEEDGFQVESQERNPLVQFNEEGIFRIQLRVIDAGGLSDFLDEPLTVSTLLDNHPPVAQAYAVTTVVPEDFFILFHDYSTDPDGDEDIIKWEWDFSYDPDDGFQVESEERDPYVQFNQEGIFQIQLRVTDAGGLSDELDEPLTVSVVNYPPVSQAYVDNTIVPEDSFVQFHDCSTDPNGYDDIVKWEWDFSYDADEGFQVESEERDPYVQFSVLGEFEVQMRVTDTAGLTDMLNEPIGITVREGGWVITWEDSYPYLKTSSIARDKSDNIYMTGTFAGNLDFDPGYGKEIRYGGQGSAYLMKLNTSGELLWVETWGPATAVAIVTDTDSVVYVLGHYSCHDLDPGPGIFEPVAHSGDYLSQFDSNGNFLNSLSTRYHTTWSGFEDYTDYEDRIVNMVPDPPYIYVVHCYYEAHSGEDPQNDYVFWNYNLMKFNQGSVDIMDPDWVNYIPDEAEFIGLNLLDHGTVLLNYYLSAVQSQCLITAYSSNGQIQWALPFLNPGIRLYQVAIDNSGNIYATGSFSGLQDFDPGPGEFLLDSHSGRAYLCKFNINSEFLWAAQWGAHAGIRGNWITTDPNGNIYIAGRFSGYADFDPGPDEYVRLGDTSESSYVSVFDPSGNWMWMGDWSAYICEDYGSTDTPEHPIVATDSGNTYITGTFYGTADFNPSWDISQTTAGDDGSTYLLKILPPGVW